MGSAPRSNLHSRPRRDATSRFPAAPSVAKQYLSAGLIDEIQIHLVPVFLGEGVRLFEDPAVAGIPFEQVHVVEAPGVTHLTYRPSRNPSADLPRIA